MNHRIEDINQREKEAKLNFQSLEFRLNRLEELAQQTVNSMSVIHRFMSSHMSDSSPSMLSSQPVMSASGTEAPPAEVCVDTSGKTLKPRTESNDLKDGISPSKVTFATVRIINTVSLFPISHLDCINQLFEWLPSVILSVLHRYPFCNQAT